MEYKDEKGNSSSRKQCCSINRLQCVLILLVFVAMGIAIGVLAGLLAGKDSCPEATPTPTTEPIEAAKLWENHRLPDYIIPEHYDLTLYPDFYDGRGEFTGNVTITLNVTKSSSHLLIHIRDLKVIGTRLRRGGKILDIAKTFHYEKNEYWVVEAADVIQKGLIQVEMQFEGSLVNGIVGLYKSVYINTLTNETRLANWLKEKSYLQIIINY